jgi:ATP-binding cassette subfamily B protein
MDWCFGAFAPDDFRSYNDKVSPITRFWHLVYTKPFSTGISWRNIIYRLGLAMSIYIQKNTDCFGGWQ